MTLILGMVKAEGVYLSTDYRVSDSRTGRLVDDGEAKFFSIQFPPIESGPRGVLAYTGLARLRDGTKMSAWIRETLRGEAESFDDLMAHLLIRLNRDISAYREQLIINVLVQESSRRSFGGFSNVEQRPGQGGYSIASSFGYKLDEVKSPFWFANGSGAAGLRRKDRRFMDSQLGVTPRKPSEHLKLLATVNRRVAAREPTVSPFCHAGFVGTERERSESIVFVEKGESVPFQMPSLLGSVDLTGIVRQVHENFEAHREGRQVEDWDIGEVNEELKRRP